MESISKPAVDPHTPRRWRKNLKTAESVERGAALLKEVGHDAALAYFLGSGVPLTIAVRVLTGAAMRGPSK